MAKQETKSIEIQEINVSRVRCAILGETPMIMHRFDRKAWEELLFPKGRANRAEREQSLKHDPIAEFRGSIYMNRNPREASAIHVPAGSFSAAISNAALDLPGASKSQIKRLTTVSSPQINLFGVPRLVMHMTRSSDIARTPDVRTRAVFPVWACMVEVEYVSSLIKQGHVINLLSAAGRIGGLGDWRPQKGGSYGKFRIVAEDDKEYLSVIKSGGRGPQEEAIKHPVAADADTEELLAWFEAEVKAREKVVPSASANSRKNGKAPPPTRKRRTTTELNA